MIFFILVAAQVVSLAFRGLQRERLFQDMFAMVPGGTMSALVFVLFLLP